MWEQHGFASSCLCPCHILPVTRLSGMSSSGEHLTYFCEINHAGSDPWSVGILAQGLCHVLVLLTLTLV